MKTHGSAGWDINLRVSYILTHSGGFELALQPLY